MTSHTKKNSPTKNDKSKSHTTRKKHVTEKAYIASLKEFWEGRLMTSLERLTKMLADDQLTKGLTFKLYRLWIEILAVQEEQGALRSLWAHLAHLAQEDHSTAFTYQALQGLIHYELDEFEAAHLLQKAIGQSSDPYAIELRHLTETRTQPEAVLPLLWTIRDELQDFFHLQTLARGLFLLKDNLKLRWVIDHITQRFRGSPVQDLFDMHIAVDQKNYEKAGQAALALVERFPGNSDYRFHLGYIAVMVENYAMAIKQLSMANDLTDHSDPDILNWLGFALSETAIQEGSRHNLEEARRLLEHSINISIQRGIPATFPNQQLVKVKRALGEKGEEASAHHIWMVKLGAHKFYELKTASIGKIQEIRKAMGEGPQQGDLCLLVGDDFAADDAAGQSFRLGAIYTVDADPVWHPLYQYQTVMSLLFRPEVSIPFAVDQIDEDSGSETASVEGEMVYELAPDALGLIENAIAEFLGEDNTLVHTLKDYQAST